MKKDEGDWFGKRPPPMTATGRVDLIGYGMANVPPGGAALHSACRSGSRRAYGLLAFASFVFAIAEAVQAPRDWIFVAICASFGVAFLAALVAGHR